MRQPTTSIAVPIPALWMRPTECQTLTVTIFTNTSASETFHQCPEQSRRSRRRRPYSTSSHQQRLLRLQWRKNSIARFSRFESCHLSQRLLRRVTMSLTLQRFLSGRKDLAPPNPRRLTRRCSRKKSTKVQLIRLPDAVIWRTCLSRIFHPSAVTLHEQRQKYLKRQQHRRGR